MGQRKDKRSGSDVRGRLKGTFLGFFHGYPDSCSSLLSQCARHTSLLPQPPLLSFHGGEVHQRGLSAVGWEGKAGREVVGILPANSFSPAQALLLP